MVVHFNDPAMPPQEHAVLTGYDSYCTTRYPDGAESSNWVPAGGDYPGIAASLGFGETLNELQNYCFEHECFHSLVPMVLFKRASYVVWNSAHHLPGRMIAAYEEERLVYYLQQAYHGKIPIIDPQWHEVINRARRLLSAPQA